MNARTIRLAYNSQTGDIQAALQNLPVIGGKNVLVTGGPLPVNPVTVSFVGDLADTPVSVLQVNLSPDVISGIGGPSAPSPQVAELCDVANNPLTISATVDQTVAGVSNDSQMNSIAPADQHAMEEAIDDIRPQTVFVTTQNAMPTTKRQPVNGTHASSSFTEVLSYVTGASNIKWPAKDGTHWIQAGIENEAPQGLNTSTSHYQGFHNISSVQAYTESALGALLNPFYLNPSQAPAGTQPTWVQFFNVKIGPFSQKQVALVPALKSYTNPTQQYSPSYAPSVTPQPLVITNRINGVNFINYEYPTDYLNLPGVPQLPTSNLFWSSIERLQGTDYLEIDLGSVQAVNYISFDATSKPYSISVAYDTLDMYPDRNFVPATFIPSSASPSVTSLAYVNATTNPWSTVTMNITNALGGMIYTRVLRIGFTKTPENTPYLPNPQNPIPYSIEVKNLRVGRNISSTTPIGGITAIPTPLGPTTSTDMLFPGDDVFPDPNLYPGPTT